MSKHNHHGRTPAAWTGSILTAVAFVVGSIAAVLGPNWPLVWVSAALLLIGMVSGLVLRKLGYGQG